MRSSRSTSRPGISQSTQTSRSEKKNIPRAYQPNTNPFPTNTTKKSEKKENGRRGVDRRATNVGAGNRLSPGAGSAASVSSQNSTRNASLSGCKECHGRTLHGQQQPGLTHLFLRR